MMVKPTQALKALQQLQDSAAIGSSELDQRNRQARLSFAAILHAMRGSCDCEPCRLLRQAADLILKDVSQEAASDA